MSSKNDREWSGFSIYLALPLEHCLSAVSASLREAAYISVCRKTVGTNVFFEDISPTSLCVYPHLSLRLSPTSLYICPLKTKKLPENKPSNQDIAFSKTPYLIETSFSDSSHYISLKIIISELPSSTHKSHLLSSS